MTTSKYSRNLSCSILKMHKVQNLTDRLSEKWDRQIICCWSLDPNVYIYKHTNRNFFRFKYFFFFFLSNQSTGHHRLTFNLLKLTTLRDLLFLALWKCYSFSLKFCNIVSNQRNVPFHFKRQSIILMTKQVLYTSLTDLYWHWKWVRKKIAMFGMRDNNEEHSFDFFHYIPPPAAAAASAPSDDVCFNMIVITIL